MKTYEQFRVEIMNSVEEPTSFGQIESMAAQAYADQQVNEKLDELIGRLDRGYKDYVWYKHLRKEVESLKIKQP